jgi:microsomal epoxide hydrolase
MIVPFQIPWDPGGLADLTQRLRATRWNDAVVSDWSYGMERGFLQQLIGYWMDRYDWAERRAILNRLPHFRTTIEGYGLHFLHYRGRGPDAVPLLLMNGWPSSFVEYQRLAVLLSQGELSFEVVVPTQPGFGFSDRQIRPYQVEPSNLYPKLMTALGYDRFMVSGTDIGSGVATRIALHYPDRVIAAHVSAVAKKPQAQRDLPASPAEHDYEARGQFGIATREDTSRSKAPSHRPWPLPWRTPPPAWPAGSWRSSVTGPIATVMYFRCFRPKS